MTTQVAKMQYITKLQVFWFIWCISLSPSKPWVSPSLHVDIWGPQMWKSYKDRNRCSASHKPVLAHFCWLIVPQLPGYASHLWCSENPATAITKDLSYRENRREYIRMRWILILVHKYKFHSIQMLNSAQTQLSMGKASIEEVNHQR